MIRSKPLSGFNGIKGGSPSCIVALSIVYYPNPQTSVTLSSHLQKHEGTPRNSPDPVQIFQALKLRMSPGVTPKSMLNI